MKLIPIALLITVLVSCDHKKPAVVKSAQTEKPKRASIQNPEVKVGIEGFYTGAFKASQYNENKNFTDVNKITICIDSLNDQLIYGHSIVAGNDRPFSGSYTKDDKGYTATLKEPGDDKYDGVFTLTISSGNKLSGKWVANDQSLAVSERKYELKRQLYEYNPLLELPENIDGFPLYIEDGGKSEVISEDVLHLNASEKLLASKDVENLYRADLEVIRNAIYARHGYSFKNIRMRNLFDNYVDWYMPVATNVSNYLTKIELKNIELIKRYEKHAERYYDDFGR